MIIRTAPSSIDVLDPWHDVTVHVTFKTVDPHGLTEVVIDPEPRGDGLLLQLVDAAIARLVVYRNAFIDAEDGDTGSLPPTPLPEPWYGWGR